MPISTSSQTFVCEHCGWKKTLLNVSDVRFEGRTWFERCPECQSEEVTHRRSTAIELGIEKIRSCMKK